MNPHKILLFEPIHPKGLDQLVQHGIEVVYAEGTSPEQILAAVGDVDAILARAQGTIDAATMDAAPNLKVIGRHGIGVDNVDVEAATKRGIQVVNTPSAPSESVAEFVVMAMIALPRGIHLVDAATRRLDWGYRNRHRAPELMGRTVGIVGFGRIGRRIAEICSLGFRMNILYTDAVAAPEEEEKRLSATRVELDDLLRGADFITLNVPLVPETHHLIDAGALSRIRPHAYLINCSRGAVIDEAALLEALREKRIAGAALDVFETEPVERGNGLLELENVLLTPHVSGMSQESVIAMSMVAKDIVRVLKGMRPEFPVNQPPVPRQHLE